MSTAQKLWFCTQTRIGRALVALTQMVSPAVGAAIVLWLIYNVEMLAFPVVSDFKIERLELSDGYYVTSGTYTKKRPCELVVTNIVYAPSDSRQPGSLVHQIRHEDLGANLPVGTVRWGPYKVPAQAGLDPEGRIEVIGVHRCHTLWGQHTHYASVPVKNLPTK